MPTTIEKAALAEQNAESKRQLASNEIAARLITRHIGRMNEAWHEIDALNTNYPHAPVGNSWQTVRGITSQLTAMVKSWDNKEK